jgi:hypothetical protein
MRSRILALLTKSPHKIVSISIIPENIPAFDSARHNVTKRAWGIYSGFSWHIDLNSQTKRLGKSIYEYPYHNVVQSCAAWL